MEIMTNSENKLEADWVLETETREGVQQMTIHFAGNVDPVEIVKEMTGQEQIVGINKNGNKTIYEKYTLFKSLISTNDGNAIRLTLERKQK